jgi:hypothetical protein
MKKNKYHEYITPSTHTRRPLGDNEYRSRRSGNRQREKHHYINTGRELFNYSLSGGVLIIFRSLWRATLALIHF